MRAAYMIKIWRYFLFAFVSPVYAVTFSITPQSALPTSLPQEGKVTALLIVKNTTDQTLTNNFVKLLPQQVTQVDCSNAFCGKTFTLGPAGSTNDSCILKLSVKGPVSATEEIKVCNANESLCDVAQPWSVTESAAIPFVSMAAGNYSDHRAHFFPLVAYTIDHGANWVYPKEVFEDLQTRIDPSFESGLLAGGQCTGGGAKSLCIATGHYCAAPDCQSLFPLIAVGKQNLALWYYPTSVYHDLTQKIDPNLTGGLLNNGSCVGSNGSAACIGVGFYFTQQANFPLVAVTVNGGNDWTYPASVFQNLQNKVDPDFKSGFFAGASCSQSGCNRICIATGSFCKDSFCNLPIPLLAMSTQDSLNWTYPTDIFQNLTTVIDPKFTDGFLKSASCTNSKTSSLCIATGQYFNGSTTYPLLAQSQDIGQSWHYPHEIFTNLETVIAHGFRGGFFNGASCTGREKKAVCIAAGAYFTKSRHLPLLAVTRNGGDTWSYPPFIYTKLRTVVNPNAITGTFDSASCSGNGSTALCVAAGNFCLLSNPDSGCDLMPLVALSNNGGKNWSYPSAVYTNLATKIDASFKSGFFNSVSCHTTATRSLCVAGGQYTTTNFEVFPMVAMSTDRGLTWTYPQEIHQNLNVKIDPDFALASFVSSSVTGDNLKLLYKKKKFKINLFKKERMFSEQGV